MHTLRLEYNEWDSVRDYKIVIDYSTLNLPPSLRSLIVGWQCELEGFKCPPSLTSIIMRHSALPPTFSRFPPDCKTLDLSQLNVSQLSEDDVRIGAAVRSHHMHASLSRLLLPDLDRVSNSKLPPSLTTLSFQNVSDLDKNSSTSTLSSIHWPQTLTDLTLPANFNEPIASLNLPHSIRRLSLSEVKHALDGLPLKLEYLSVILQHPLRH